MHGKMCKIQNKSGYSEECSKACLLPRNVRLNSAVNDRHIYAYLLDLSIQQIQAA